MKVNLTAVARFKQSMAKHHAEATEESLMSEEALSLLPITNSSQVHQIDSQVA